MIEAFDQLVAESGSACSQQRTRDRLRSHLLAQLVCLGEHTVTGLLSTTGQQFRDWTAAYRLYARDRVDARVLLDTVRRGIEQTANDVAPLVVAMDDSILRKRGRKIPGSAWRPDPLGAPFQVNFVWAQRVLQMAAAVPEALDGAARTIPMDFALAPTAARPRPRASAEDWKRYRQEQKRLNINRLAVSRLETLVRQRQEEQRTRPLWVTVDGRFTNRTFLKGVPAGVAIIGRIRGDARFHEAVMPMQGSPLGGRPRWYGRALPTPEQVRQDDSIPWQDAEAFAAGRRHTFKIKVMDRVRWRVTGAKQTLRVIVIAPLAYRPRKGGWLLYRKPAYLICTDPSLPLEQVLQAYLWRWGIEVNFRDEKTLLGVGQARVRNPHSASHIPASAVAAYAMLLLAAHRSRRLSLLPLPVWRRDRRGSHITTASLINQLRCELWAHSINGGLHDFSSALPRILKSQKPHPHLHSAVFYAIAG